VGEAIAKRAFMDLSREKARRGPLGCGMLSSEFEDVTAGAGLEGGVEAPSESPEDSAPGIRTESRFDSSKSLRTPDDVKEPSP
jgi:hypothetical protein